MLIYVFILWILGTLFVAGKPLTVRLRPRQTIPNRSYISSEDLQEIQKGEYSDLFLIQTLTTLSEGTICIAAGSLLTVADRVGFIKDKKGNYLEIYHLSKTYIDHFKEPSLKQSDFLKTGEFVAFYDERAKDWKVMNLKEVENICGHHFYPQLEFHSSLMKLTFKFPFKINNIVLDPSISSRLVFIPQGDDFKEYSPRPYELKSRLKALVASTQSNSESQIQEGSHSKEKFSISEVNYKISEYRWKCSQSDIPMSSCQVRTDHDGHSPFVPEIEKFPSNLPTTSRNPAISTQLQSELTPEEINNWIEDLYDPKPW